MRRLIFIGLLLSQKFIYAKNIIPTFGGDGLVRGFSVRDNSDVKDQGYAQLFRLKVDVDLPKRVQVRTRTVLSGDRWAGDSANNKVSGNFDDGSGGNSVRLDYAYLNIPLPMKSRLQVGRTVATFSDCFNVCDDRRDRIFLLKFLGKVGVGVLQDKRVEGQTTKGGDDASLYGVGAFYNGPEAEWAILLGTWKNADGSYFLKDVINFSPFYKYKGEDVNWTVIWSWAGLGDRGAAYSGHHNSFALNGNYRLNGWLEVGAHGIYSDDGALIAPGYDTYSFVINNDPDNYRSNTRLIRMGGFGTSSGGSIDDEYMALARARVFTGDYVTSFVFANVREVVSRNEQDLNVFDIHTNYNYSENVKLEAGVALVRGDRNEEATRFQAVVSF